MASRLISGCQVLNNFLSIREKGVVLALIEPQCKLISSAVAQVVIAVQSQWGSPHWTCLGCGMVCLIEDQSVNSYFLRLYCVKCARLLWQQELYVPFKYSATRSFFHTFPADGHQAGLNFADDTEAEALRLAVETIQRNQEVLSGCTDSDSSNNRPHTSGLSDSGVKPVKHVDEEKHFPTSVRSVSVSFRELDPDVRKLVREAGRSEEHLEDKDSADTMIKTFVGLKVAQKDMMNTGMFLRGSAPHTLPRAKGASVSLALKKGPLPAIPSQQTPKRMKTPGRSKLPPWIPPPPSTPAPTAPEKLKKSVTAVETAGMIQNEYAINEKHHRLQHHPSADGLDTNSDD